MLVTNRGIVIIMTNPQKTVFLIKTSCIYANKISFREESSQTNVILPYKLLAAILSAVCSVIQQS